MNVRNAFDQYFEDFVFLKAFLVTRICFQIWGMIILRCHPVRHLASVYKIRKLKWKKKYINSLWHVSPYFLTFIFDVCHRNCDFYQIVILRESRSRMNIVNILVKYVIDIAKHKFATLIGTLVILLLHLPIYVLMIFSALNIDTELIQYSNTVFY